MNSEILARIERLCELYRQDVAAQLESAARHAGLTATVRLDAERAVLEFEEDAPRIIASFNDERDGAPGWCDWVTLYVEGDEQTRLVTLAWQEDVTSDKQQNLARRLAELEARTDRELRLDRRGLNAKADVHVGRYAKPDVTGQLTAHLTQSAASALPACEPSKALVVFEPRRDAAISSAHRPDELDRAYRVETRPPEESDLEGQRADVRELVISNLMHRLQQDLAEAESNFVSVDAAAMMRSRVGRTMEWAMLGTAYAVEAKTNQIAVSSFLGGGGASWLYGLVGPVLIGGLAFVSNSKLGKGAAYALMLGWAMAMASITASHKDYLDGAQGYFPKDGQVLAHEQSVGAARVRKQAADAELQRLSVPVEGAGSLLLDARQRWQAGEIKRATEREAKTRDNDRTRAQHAAIDAGVALNKAELLLREAMQNDPSRAWAWRTLFLLFAVINLAGPLAISRVLEQWRAEHGTADARAKDEHLKRSTATLLRGSRAAQKAHATLLLPAVLEDLKRRGIEGEVIAGMNLADISDETAKRFDGAVNSRRAPRGLFGRRGSPVGPT